MVNVGTPQKPRIFYLEQEPYNLSYLHGDKKVKDLFAVGEEETHLKWAWAVATGDLYKMSRDEFRELYYWTACILDAAYAFNAPNMTQIGFMNTFNRTIIPVGKFYSNMNVPFSRAGLEGQGNFVYGGNGFDHGLASTEIVMVENWIDKFDEQVLLHTPSYFLPSGVDELMSYNESFLVQKIRLTGPNKRDDNKVRIGIAFGRSGEASKWDLIKSDHFDYGIVARGGVPMAGGVCSVFHNRIAGFAGRGTALATMDVELVSGDSNGSLLRLEPAYNSASGGSLRVGLVKAEDAISPAERGEYSGQIVGWFEGQYHVTLDNVRMSAGSFINDAVFVLDNRIAGTNYGPQGSYLRASGNGFRYNTLVHNLATQTRISTQGDFLSWGFEHYALDDSFHTNAPGNWAKKPAGPVPLGALPRDPMTGLPIGSFDYVNGLPARTDKIGGGNTTTTTTKPPVTTTTTSTTTTTTRPPTTTTTTTSTTTTTTLPPTTTTTSTTTTTTLPPTTTTTTTVGVIDKRKFTASANITWQNSDPANVLDGNPGTFWASGREQRVGDYLMIDMNGNYQISEVTFNLGTSLWDYPRKYEIQVRTTTTGAWTTVASGSGNQMQADYTAKFTKRTIRQFRMVLTGSDPGFWFTIFNINAA